MHNYPGLVNALMKMLVLNHEAKRSGVEKAQCLTTNEQD